LPKIFTGKTEAGTTTISHPKPHPVLPFANPQHPLILTLSFVPSGAKEVEMKSTENSMSRNGWSEFSFWLGYTTTLKIFKDKVFSFLAFLIFVLSRVNRANLQRSASDFTDLFS